MRPRASTAVASTITSPAPPTAREPRWTRCQSLAKPSSELYSHIGETPMRLGRVTERSASGSKRWGTASTYSAAAAQATRSGAGLPERTASTLSSARNPIASRVSMVALPM